MGREVYCSCSLSFCGEGIVIVGKDTNWEGKLLSSIVSPAFFVEGKDIVALGKEHLF